MNLYQYLQLGVIAAFVVVIADWRIPAGAVYIMPRRTVQTLPLVYILALGLVVYTVITLPATNQAHWLILTATLAGALLAGIAKDQLGDAWTKAGMYLPTTSKVKTGLYRYLYHPMYVGISLFALAACTLVILCAAWGVALVITSATLYVLVFLWLSAAREAHVKTVEAAMAEVAASEGMGTLPMGVIQSCEPATGAGYWGCLGDFFN